jgi:hypothetical protein
MGSVAPAQKWVVLTGLSVSPARARSISTGHFARFAPSPRWRNISVFGMLDEIRHAQIQLSLSHDLLKHDPRFDWIGQRRKSPR